MSLTAEQRRALVLLATTQRVQDGATEALMLMNGFQSDMLAGLVLAGFAADRDRDDASRRRDEVERYRFTDEGRAALAAGA